MPVVPYKAVLFSPVAIIKLEVKEMVEHLFPSCFEVKEMVEHWYGGMWLAFKPTYICLGADNWRIFIVD